MSPAGTYDVPLTMKKSGIGANGTQCLPVTGDLLPCNVQVASAKITGAYTGEGSFALQAPITYSTSTPPTVPPTTPTTRPPVIIITLPGGGTTIVEVLGTQQTSTTVAAVDRDRDPPVHRRQQLPLVADRPGRDLPRPRVPGIDRRPQAAVHPLTA